MHHENKGEQVVLFGMWWELFGTAIMGLMEEALPTNVVPSLSERKETSSWSTWMVNYRNLNDYSERTTSKSKNSSIELMLSRNVNK